MISRADLVGEASCTCREARSNPSSWARGSSTWASRRNFRSPPATGLSTAFQRLGIVTGRLKTGTPPRVRASSVDFGALEEQPGDEDPLPFSHRTDRERFPLLPQISCHVATTNPAVIFTAAIGVLLLLGRRRRRRKEADDPADDAADDTAEGSGS